MAKTSSNKKKPTPSRAKSKKPIKQYEHKDKTRINNPPVGLVTPDSDPPPPPEKAKTKYAYDPHIDPALQFDPQRSEIENIIDDALASDSLEETKAALTELKKRQKPYLNWAGKAERTTFEIPNVSLHVHERIDPKTIIQSVKTRNGNTNSQFGLFQEPDQNPPLRDALDFYKHPRGWSNRLIAGDSLLVMNSLLEKEGMAGKVQMVYIDPPYGIKYGSNFQPFVDRRDVKDRKDDDLTREPEMLKAFRDTWELGIHSYLAYLRDRLILARELLHESGSCFVQISDENLHFVRDLLDEVFGVQNQVSVISFRTKIPLNAKHLPNIADYLVWYAKDKSQLKFNRLFTRRDQDAKSQYSNAMLPDGRVLKQEELTPELNANAAPFTLVDLMATGFTETCHYDFEFEGRIAHPKPANSWKTTPEGMQCLIAAGRVMWQRTVPRFVAFWRDYPVMELTNQWTDTQGAVGKVFAVQTSEKVAQRCMLMTTDPGDLVLDITCGSGTTACVAEQWGRRWITTDTSRVAITLTKERLMTGEFNYYSLAHPEQGIGSGFVYKTVPHVTLGSIANNPEIKEGMSREAIDAAIAKYAPQETLYDQPKIDKSKARITGPFTVEAVPAPIVAPISDVQPLAASDTSVSREGETLRQSQWRDELLKTGIRGKGGQILKFIRVEPLPGAKYLHAQAEITPDAGPLASKRALVCFGPQHAPLEQRAVALAFEEAAAMKPKPDILLFAAFRFDPEAAKDVDEMNPVVSGMTFMRAEMNDDLNTEDLKKKRSSNESFWLIGQPDISLKQIDKGDDKGKYIVEVHGFDYFDMKKGTVVSGGTNKIAMWMLDTDYDGRAVNPQQVFFPMAGPKDGWARLAKSLKAEIDQEKIEAYRGTVSLPFEMKQDNQRIAVKLVDDRGIESLVLRDLNQ